jgi:hypothetical protein
MATKKKWSAKVKTVSTYPEKGLFTQSPNTIAKQLASKEVSPKGPASGMRMLNFYINRAGRNLSTERHEALEKAKTILSKIIADKSENSGRKSATKNSSSKPKKKSAKKSTSRNIAKKAA